MRSIENEKRILYWIISVWHSYDAHCGSKLCVLPASKISCNRAAVVAGGSLYESILLHVFVSWKLLSYLGTCSWCRIDHPRVSSDGLARCTLGCMGCNTELQGNSASCQVGEGNLTKLCQRKFNFWGHPIKRTERVWGSICESLSGRLLQLMNCQVIRSFPSMHTIWINFRSHRSAVQLPIMWATLSDAGNSNMKQTREAELRWARSHLLEPRGLRQGRPSTLQHLYDRQRQSPT